ncbi:MAG: MarR family transcriptional regulator [Xanthobacteraceae bacterium]|nr:MAG: MarR family transcriptional regulator [Xanthobacteraceae bacterium]
MMKPAGRDAKETANGAGWEGGGEKIDLTVHEQYVGFRMRIVQLQFFQLFYQVPDFKGLSPTDVSVLLAIDANPGVRPGQLTEALMIKRSNLSKLIVHIENAGLITRRGSSSDKRTFGLHLTAKGHALAKRLAVAMRKHDLDASSGLSEHERLITLGLLGKLSDNLRAKLAHVDAD